MNEIPKPVKAYVNDAFSSSVIVKIVDETIVSALYELGFKRGHVGTDQLSLKVSGKTEKASILKKLRDFEVCFSAGGDWCPSDIFEDLRNHGLITGSYRRIAWRGPNQPFVTEDC